MHPTDRPANETRAPSKTVTKHASFSLFSLFFGSFFLPFDVCWSLKRLPATSGFLSSSFRLSFWGFWATSLCFSVSSLFLLLLACFLVSLHLFVVKFGYSLPFLSLICWSSAMAARPSPSRDRPGVRMLLLPPFLAYKNKWERPTPLLPGFVSSVESLIAML